MGVDLVDMRRVRRALERWGEKFERRVYTPGEMDLARGRGGDRRASTYAKRFAMKEACAKALGMGVSGLGVRGGARWREIETVRGAGGRPELRLSGRALERAEKLASGGGWRITASLTSDGDYACAFASLEGASLEGAERSLEGVERLEGAERK